MKMPVISVVIPVYNVEKYLSKCLESITNQTYKNLEIICVDDGSTDKSQKILEEYSKKDSRIKILLQPNSGQGVARNRGIDEAAGDYIFFCDADDYLEQSAFEQLLSRIETTGADFVFFESNVFDDRNGNSVDNSFWGGGGYLDIFREKELFRYSDIPILLFKAFAPWNKFFRTSFLKENNISFDENLRFEDVIFHIKALLLASAVTYCPYHLYNYRYFTSTSCTERFKNSKESLDILEVIKNVENLLYDRKVDENILKLFVIWVFDILVCYYNNISDIYLKKTFRKRASYLFKQIKMKYNDADLCEFVPEHILKALYRILKNKLFSIYKITNYLYINIFYLKIRLNLRRFA